MSFEITNNVEIKIDFEVEIDDEMEAMIDCDDGFEFEIKRVDDFIDCPFDEMNDDDVGVEKEIDRLPAINHTAL